MSNAFVVRSFRAFCLVLALALFAPLIAATPAHAAIVSFNCAAGGGTYQVSDGTLTGTTGTCTGALVLNNSVTTINYLSLYQTQITSLTIPASVLTVTNPFYYNKAPIPPGIASLSRIVLSMFSARQWDAPETKVVPISAACTAADATAADAPKVTNKVELVTPKPMPSEPSIN
jgi:hypothetical protein